MAAIKALSFDTGGTIIVDGFAQLADRLGA